MVIESEENGVMAENAANGAISVQKAGEGNDNL